MPQATVIFKNQHYTACEIQAQDRLTLCVTHNHKRHGRQGVYLVGEQAAEWIDAIKTAMDASEANLLCRAVLA